MAAFTGLKSIKMDQKLQVYLETSGKARFGINQGKKNWETGAD
jgi:hypothetical protein